MARSGQGNLVELDLAGLDVLVLKGSETLRGVVCLLPSSSRPKLPLLSTVLSIKRLLDC